MNHCVEKVNPGIILLIGALSILLAAAFAVNFSLIGEVGMVKYIFLAAAVFFGVLGAILIFSLIND